MITNNQATVIDWLNCKKGNPILYYARSYLLINYESLPDETYFIKKLLFILIKKYIFLIIYEAIKINIRLQIKNLKNICYVFVLRV